MELMSAWSIVKEVKDLCVQIFNLKVSKEVQEKLNQIQEKNSKLYDRIVYLEDEKENSRSLIISLQTELEKIKNFKLELIDYKLVKSSLGTVVYKYTQDDNNASIPKHFICPNCAINYKKSILQPIVGKGNTQVICHQCKSEFGLK